MWKIIYHVNKLWLSNLYENENVSLIQVTPVDEQGCKFRKIEFFYFLQLSLYSLLYHPHHFITSDNSY